MKTWAFAVAALLLSAGSSAAQNAPRPTPVLPCDTNAITGSRFLPPRVIATRSGSTAETEQRPTVISLSTANGATRYFVAETPVPLTRLGRLRPKRG
jgi:hypothetical protein